MAGMSEAIKFSFSPMPTTRGLPFLAPIRTSGSFSFITPIANEPSTSFKAFLTAVSSLFPSFTNLFTR